MTRVIAIVSHGLLVMLIAIGALTGSGAGVGALMKAMQLVLLAGGIGSIVVLVRHGGGGRIAVVLFNALLLLFAVVAALGLIYYQLRFGGQPLIVGFVTIVVASIPPIASILALRTRAGALGSATSVGRA
jgi:hypothetical protein